MFLPDFVGGGRPGSSSQAELSLSSGAQPQHTGERRDDMIAARACACALMVHIHPSRARQRMRVCRGPGLASPVLSHMQRAARCGGVRSRPRSKAARRRLRGPGRAGNLAGGTREECRTAAPLLGLSVCGLLSCVPLVLLRALRVLLSLEREHV